MTNEPIAAALRHIDTEFMEEDEYRASVIDLRDTGANYAYVTVVYTDNGDTEKVAVVLVTYPESVHDSLVCHTILEGEY